MSPEPGGCSNQRPTEELTVRVERLTKKLEEKRREKERGRTERD